MPSADTAPWYEPLVNIGSQLVETGDVTSILYRTGFRVVEHQDIHEGTIVP